ncbi:MAG TPA: class I adenylate-forming enzyme family protein [Myxococcota bacterium]|nr:class I adenylate-forming enzyme family protein [Myxococcota bacterium]
MESLACVIDRHARRIPERVAFAAGDARLTWGAYAEGSDRVAERLARAGLGSGDRVGVLLPDGPGVHLAYVAAEKAGLVAVGIGPRAGAAEIRHLLALTQARALISPAIHREHDLRALVGELCADGVPLEHHFVVEGELLADSCLARGGAGRPSPTASAPKPREPDELFLLNSTSGTTGLPKCVMHDQRRWFAFHELAVEAADLSPNDVFLSALPAPFGFGIWTAHVTPTLLGAPCVLLPRFDADRLVREIDAHRVSVLAAVSTQFILMLESPEQANGSLRSLRVLFTGGEAVPYARAAAFEERTGARVLQFYGSNETGALSRTTLRDSRDVRLRSAGRVIDSMQVRLFDDDARDVTASGRGQPGCKGPLCSRGYYGDDVANHSLFTPDGWMLTGDVVEIDAAGVLRVVGRKADFIIRGGKNVSAPAVEEAVCSHPTVALAAAVAMPDPVFGERVCVYAELKPGRALELSELVAHLVAQGVSVEYLPERLVVVDALPRASGGKIAKGALRADIARRVAAGE